MYQLIVSRSSQGIKLNSARNTLLQRFSSRIRVDPFLTRRVVSYQGNRGVPGLRWFRYKEGFSQDLVETLIRERNPTSLLDPFSGLGTAPLTASDMGIPAVGVDVMPVGIRAGRAIASVPDIDACKFALGGKYLLNCLNGVLLNVDGFEFPHVPITEGAFSEQVEMELSRLRRGLHDLGVNAFLLDVACMSILEEVSYTRKDGQYLRWDARSGRSGSMYKGQLPSLPALLRIRLDEIFSDMEFLSERAASVEFVEASSMEHLPNILSDSFDIVVTSPPYVNRYDYTRIYALELAWLGYDQQAFSKLRQSMVTATVENKPKNVPSAMVEAQEAYQEARQALLSASLNNPNLIRMLDGYFADMAFVIAELARVVRPGGYVYMVNDNVQYHGEEIPVDLILSDFAEQYGFECEEIRVLPRGKGNSSQQMSKYGRRELRKCLYCWRLPIIN